MKPNVSPTAARAALAALLSVALATATFAQTAPTYTVPAPSDVGEAFPRDAVVADFNGDGHLDLVVTTNFPQSPASQRINLLANNGGGIFALQAPISLGNAGGIATGDFNGDGRLDLAVTSGGSAQCLGQGTAVFLGQAGPLPFLFRAPCLNGVPAPAAAQAGDFNKDGRLDIAVASNGGGDMRIYLGNGDGSFQAGVLVNSSNLIVQDMAPAVDVNGDGLLDLVVGASNTYRAFLGRADGRFDAGAATVTGDNTLAVGVADLTGDGRPDLATIEQIAGGATQLRVRNGLGNGAFDVGVIVSPFAPGAADLTIADLDADGDMDIAVAGGPTTRQRLFLNNGGVFTTSGLPLLGSDPFRAVSGDFNHDGLSDVAMIGPRQGANAQVFVALQDDRQAPTVDITSPADGSTVRGMVTISANASDSNGVTRVEFFANDAPIGSSTGPNFSITWDTSALTGNFTIRARAFDPAGNAGEDSISVIVADQVNPTVDITSPADGSTVRGVVNITATAADNVGVTRVDFFANEMPIGSSTGPTYSVSWDASGLAGNFTLRARAFDAAGNSADDTISVTVADTAAPSAPTNLTGESLQNFHAARLSWTAATDNTGVAFYRVYELVRVGGRNTVWELVADRVEGTTTVVEIRNRRGQAHTFAVTAVDAAGNESARSDSADVAKNDHDDNN